MPAGKSLTLRDNNVKEKGSNVELNLGITNWKYHRDTVAV